MGGTELTRVSVKDAVFSAFRFVPAAGSRLWLSVLLPTLAGAAGLYVSFYFYLLEYETYVRQPTETARYFVLVWLLVGFFVVLFAQTVVAAAVASRFLGVEEGGWAPFRVTRRVWRLYWGYVRFALLCAAYVVLILMLQFLIGELAALPWLALVAAVLLWGGLFVLVVRIGALLAPVAVAADSGPLVRGAWRLSQHCFGSLALMVVAFAAVGVALDVAGAIVLLVAGIVPAISPDVPPADLIAVYRTTALPGMVVVVSLASLAANILMTAAGSAAWRQLTAAQSGA